MNTIYVFSKNSEILTVIDNYQIERYDNLLIVTGYCNGREVVFTSESRELSTLEFLKGDGESDRKRFSVIKEENI